MITVYLKLCLQIGFLGPECSFLGGVVPHLSMGKPRAIKTVCNIYSHKWLNCISALAPRVWLISVPPGKGR